VARIMRDPEAFRKLIEMFPSENNKLLFCVGCFTEMGVDVPAQIRYFGERDRLAWVHFRNIAGTREKFVETFPDEGETDLYAAMQAFHDVGYAGYLAPDHRLRVVGDSDWGHRYWAYALGYIKALLMAVRSQEN
jgi:mannonate dehydratase